MLDPAFAPGTGTPEPGGLMTRELLSAVRRIASNVDLCAMDMVEVSPPYDVAEITAQAAHRVVLETLTGIALRRSGQRLPERPERLMLKTTRGLRNVIVGLRKDELHVWSSM